MAIPVNIEDLLHKRKIESTRIEFKTGWNPDKIYHTICAFANDFDNIGGGYIVVGVEEEKNTGIAKRPVTGISIEELDKIQRDMIGFNHKIEPFYLPRIDVQEIDGKYVLLIWVPAGVNRPYNVRERVTASNQSPCKWYIKTNVIKKRLIKQKDKAESITFFNYPYQAIEEAVVNALYHRDYQEREPVEITIEPDKISILSYAGLDRSISIDAIQKAERLKSRRYRNRRLGDYLKVLQLSEGRGTGIPTIQGELRRKGSKPAVIETNEERSYFLIEIPCREGFGDRVLIGDDFISADDDKINDKIKSVLLKISELGIAKRKDLHDAIKTSMPTIDRILKLLISEDLNLIEYQGSRKTGGYVLTEKGKAFIRLVNE